VLPRRLSPELQTRLVAVLIAIVLLLLLPLVPDVTTRQGQTARWTALVPPLLAVLLALITRRLVGSLAAALLVGAVFSHGIVRGVPLGVRDYIYKSLVDPWHLYILGFTLALLGMVRLMGRSGGARGVVESLSRYITSARATRVGAFVMGLLVFFDDYANCMLVGPTLRPLSDRYRVSREKLAYIVDSTAAPVAGVVLLSTWVGYETGLLGDVARDLGVRRSGYSLLLDALPYRFYCVLTLCFVLANAVLGRDFGPMLSAERRAALEGKLLRDGARPFGGRDERHAEPPAGAPRRWINAAVPIGVVVLGTLGGFVVDGGGASRLRGEPFAVFLPSFWQETLGASQNNVQVLFWAAIAGTVIAFVLPVAQRILSLVEAASAFSRGVRSSAYAVLVLVLAWGLAAVCKDLGTGAVLIGLLGERLPAVALPIATFGAAAVVAFATGTSWGTMAVLIPTAVPLAHAVGGEGLMVLSMASVLDGAIFGDHCSPISDTTLMSSIGAGSDHLDHVATQLPYALASMLAALALGYVPVAYGLPASLSYLAGASSLVLLLLLLGRRVATTDVR
jgi:Na+/H+ antiporter NhaC